MAAPCVPTAARGGRCSAPRPQREHRAGASALTADSTGSQLTALLLIAWRRCPFCCFIPPLCRARSCSELVAGPGAPAVRSRAAAAGAGAAGGAEALTPALPPLALHTRTTRCPAWAERGPLLPACSRVRVPVVEPHPGAPLGETRPNCCENAPGLPRFWKPLRVVELCREGSLARPLAAGRSRHRGKGHVQTLAAGTARSRGSWRAAASPQAAGGLPCCDLPAPEPS